MSFNRRSSSVRIVFAGTPEVAVPSLIALNREFTVVGVLTRQDAPVGRKRVMTASPVAVAAKELDLPVIKANRISADVRQQIHDLSPDIGVIVAYGGLIKEPLLSDPAFGWINLHFSALPRWRGAAPVQRALMNAERELGMTVFQLVEALDEGDVLTRDTYRTKLGASAGDVLSEMSEAGVPALLEAVRHIETITPEPQSGPASYAKKLTRQDGDLDPAGPAENLLATWAGVTPEPGARIGELKIHKLDAVRDEQLRLNPSSRSPRRSNGDARKQPSVFVDSGRSGRTSARAAAR
jgi:methionyl-tRNA formyltransferase